MGRMSTDQRQDQIIDTAMKIINADGFIAFTTRQLSREIGISEPALYRHFGSKDDILIGIIKRMERLWFFVAKEVDSISCYIDKVKTFISLHFEYIEQNSDIVAILFADEYMRRNEKVRSYLEEVQAKRYFYLIEMYEKGRITGDFRAFEPKIIAVIILGAIRATVLDWNMSSSKYSLTRHGQEVINTLIKMIEPTVTIKTNI